MKSLALALLAATALAGAAPRMHPYAPPVIPHALQAGTTCTDCHGTTIQAGVPAIPHRVAGFCQSCHVAKQVAIPFGSNTFMGDRRAHAKGVRAFPGGPPSVPHPVFMRENCQACHGREAHRGMKRNPHPERKDCLSCHVA